MKTTSKHPRLSGWWLKSIGATLGCVLCASSYANAEGKNVVEQTTRARAAVPQHKVIYLVRSTASAIPIPIEQLVGIPTTTVAMIVIGRSASSAWK